MENLIDTLVEQDKLEAERGDKYYRELLQLIESFEYEYCECCGGDVQDHVFAPDALGWPHAYCIGERE